LIARNESVSFSQLSLSGRQRASQEPNINGRPCLMDLGLWLNLGEILGQWRVLCKFFRHKPPKYFRHCRPQEKMNWPQESTSRPAATEPTMRTGGNRGNGETDNVQRRSVLSVFSCSKHLVPKPTFHGLARRAGPNQDPAGRKMFAQSHSGASPNSIFTTKDTKITKKNRIICHIQYFVSFVLFVVKMISCWNK
jgi:hypothetical protein